MADLNSLVVILEAYIKEVRKLVYKVRNVLDSKARKLLNIIESIYT